MASLVVAGRLPYFSFSCNLLLTDHESEEQGATSVPLTALGFAGLRQDPVGGTWDDQVRWHFWVTEIYFAAHVVLIK
jgi:hypothetical protein